MLKVFNTLSRRKEEFRPLRGNAVGIYTCGPSVYQRPNIGNYRTYVFEDVFKRYLLWKGFRVRHVMNLTDVENKAIAEARKEVRTTVEKARKAFEKAMDDDFQTQKSHDAACALVEFANRRDGLRKSEATLVLSAMRDFDRVFGLDLF